MGSQDAKSEPRHRGPAVFVALSIALIIAGSMIFAGTLQLKSMRGKFSELNHFVELLQRQNSALKEEKASLEQKVSSVEMKLSQKEKEVDASVELLSQKGLELKQLEKAISEQRVEVEERDKLIQQKQSQVELNKNAAKKLALVLAQAQADKERLKSDTAALIKPEIDKCNEAMAAKDAAIQGLVNEREKLDSDVLRAEAEATRAKKKLEDMERKLDQKQAEGEQLKAWKSEASREFRQQAERSKDIWAASIVHRETGVTSAAVTGRAAKLALAFPPSAATSPERLGAHLNLVSRSNGMELGVGNLTNLTTPLLAAWSNARTYVVMDITGRARGPKAKRFKETCLEIDPRLHCIQVDSIDKGVEEIEDESLDFIHVNLRYEKTALVSLLERLWGKLRSGGTLAGGFARASVADAAVRSAVVEVAEKMGRQPLFGFEPTSAGTWLLRK
mmetsp:Transcript_19939/g.47516  ORF Transcript_19939/g.47516 Transcript_19939/m.47516 type:complete len:447 (+) Transcript_19939:323-1663(+)